MCYDVIFGIYKFLSMISFSFGHLCQHQNLSKLKTVNLFLSTICLLAFLSLIFLLRTRKDKHLRCSYFLCFTLPIQIWKWCSCSELCFIWNRKILIRFSFILFGLFGIFIIFSKKKIREQLHISCEIFSNFVCISSFKINIYVIKILIIFFLFLCLSTIPVGYGEHKWTFWRLEPSTKQS